MPHTRSSPILSLAFIALPLALVAVPFGCAGKANAPQPAAPGAQQGQAAPSGRTAKFSGDWLCVYGKDRIPGALTQRGSQLTGYCLYPGNHRATFSGTINGNTMSGVLDVPHQKKQWRIEATLNGNSMNGTWGGKTKWSATRR